MTPGNGEPPFPATAPLVATYSANFVQLVPYRAAISPTNAGSVSVAPAPRSYAGANGKFLIARQPVTLTAAASAGWAFYEFNNAPFWLPGGLGANPKSFYVPDTGNPVNTTAEFSSGPVYSVGVAPDAPTSNLSVVVDNGFAYTPKNYSLPYDPAWTPGSTHTLSFASPNAPYSFNTRFAFVSWSASAPVIPATRADKRFGATAGGLRAVRARSTGGGVFSTTVTLPSTSAKYTATIAPQFAPATNFGYPPCGGSATISPASPTQDGFYPAGTLLQFSAMPASGWTFAGWTYDLTGMANPAALTANDETLVFANFNTVSLPLTVTGLKPARAVAGSPGLTLSIFGTGFSPGSLVNFNGSYRTPAYVNSAQLTIPLSAADLAAVGAFRVFVENFPPGWNGCAVFGSWPFFVS